MPGLAQVQVSIIHTQSAFLYSLRGHVRDEARLDIHKVSPQRPLVHAVAIASRVQLVHEARIVVVEEAVLIHRQLRELRVSSLEWLSRVHVIVMLRCLHGHVSLIHTPLLQLPRLAPRSLITTLHRVAHAGVSDGMGLLPALEECGIAPTRRVQSIRRVCAHEDIRLAAIGARLVERTYEGGRAEQRAFD